MSKRMRYLLSGRLLFCALLLLPAFAAGILLAFWLPKALAPIAVAERLFSLGVAVFTVNSRYSCESKTGRLFLLILLPWLGAAICLFLRPVHAKRAKTDAPPPGPPFRDELMNALSALSFYGCGLSGCRADDARYFPTGREMSESLFTDLERAETEILLDYYILARGKFFDRVLSILERKAQRGVAVKLVYDDFGCAAALPPRFDRELRARGLDAAAFHPVRPFPLGRLNRRDHRKIAVIDRKIAYTGGVNLADEYIGERIRFGHWKDSAVRVTGEAAERFAALFYGECAAVSHRDGIPCVVFGDEAERARTGEEILLTLFRAAREKLYLCTPYLAPTERIFDALSCAARAGTDVRVMIPHLPDKKSVFRLTRSYARELEAAGVRVREYTPGFLHAKSAAADGKYVFLGSYNLDGRSLHMQAECGVLLKDETLCAQLERDFLSCWETGQPAGKASFGEKLFAFFFRLFSAWI